jgi:hypothetical protein
MRQVLMLLVLVLANAHAAQAWTVVGRSGSMTLYADRDSMSRDGASVKMWSLFDYERAQSPSGMQSFLSVMSQSEYDCERQQVRRLALDFFAGHMGTGDVTFTNSEQREWVPPAPSSALEDLWTIACDAGTRGQPANPGIAL